MDDDFDLVETMKKYANGMNYVSSVVFDNGKIISARKLLPMVYAHLRGNIGLNYQVSCNNPRTRKIRNELLAKSNILSDFYDIIHKRDYTIIEDSMSITTFSHGRKIYNYPYAKQFFQFPWKFEASKVVIHKDGDYYF